MASGGIGSPKDLEITNFSSHFSYGDDRLAHAHCSVGIKEHLNPVI